MRRSGFARQPVPNSTIRPALFRHPMHSVWRVRSLSGRENELLRTCFAVWRASGWGFSEYLAVREDNLVPLPDEVSDSAGALVECFAIGAHAVRRAEIKAEQNVLVIGAGPIGLATAAIARLKGHMLLLLILTVNVASTLWIIWRLMPSIPHRKILLPRFVRPLEANWLA